MNQPILVMLLWLTNLGCITNLQEPCVEEQIIEIECADEKFKARITSYPCKEKDVSKNHKTSDPINQLLQFGLMNNDIVNDSNYVHPHPKHYNVNGPLRRTIIGQGSIKKKYNDVYLDHTLKVSFEQAGDTIIIVKSDVYINDNYCSSISNIFWKNDSKFKFVFTPIFFRGRTLNPEEYEFHTKHKKIRNFIDAIRYIRTRNLLHMYGFENANPTKEYLDSKNQYEKVGKVGYIKDGKIDYQLLYMYRVEFKQILNDFGDEFMFDMGRKPKEYIECIN